MQLSRWSALARLVYLSVDAGDFSEPNVPLLVFHVEDIVERPVEVIGDVCTFLFQL
jgi:hypothetical protein